MFSYEFYLFAFLFGITDPLLCFYSNGWEATYLAEYLIACTVRKNVVEEGSFSRDLHTVWQVKYISRPENRTKSGLYLVLNLGWAT